MISIMCKYCPNLVELPMTKREYEAITIFGIKKRSDFNLTPDQDDFMETGLCPDHEYEDTNIEVEEVA